jgi:hypothetical protein
VVVELNVGGELGTNVELSDGEYLEVEAAGVIKRFDEDDDLFDVDYQAYMNVTASQTLFTISFYRSNGENIVGSSARLPEFFEITLPEDNSQFDWTENVTLSWTPARDGQSISIYSSLSCTSSTGENTTNATSFDIDDDGLYLFDISNNGLLTVGTSGLETSELCDLTLVLQRDGVGVIDPAFDSGGEFSVMQTRKLDSLKVNLE